MIMRRLKYPVEVNRSKLQAISGPNTWPQLLAVLDWLIALIEVCEAVIEPVAQCTEGLPSTDATEESDHRTMRTLQENYQQFLSGKDDHSVEERLRQVYEERLAATRHELERLQEQQAEMEGQLQEFRNEHDRLIQIQQEPKLLAVEADGLRAAIQAADARTSRLDEEIATTEADEQLSKEAIEGLSAQAKELQAQVEAQAYSKQDIERLKHERTHLRKVLADLDAENERAEQDVWEFNMEESRLGEAIDRVKRHVLNHAEVLDGAEEPIAALDLNEATDILAALDFEEAGQRAIAATGKYFDDAKKEEAAVHEVLEQQRVTQEALSQRERECRQLKSRLEQLSRLREEQRVTSEIALDDARKTAEDSEDAVRAAEQGTAAPTLRELNELDELRLRLKELEARREADRALFEDRVRREQEAKEQHQQAMQRELRLALEGVEKIEHDIGKAVMELAQDTETEAPRGGA